MILFFAFLFACALSLSLPALAQSPEATTPLPAHKTKPRSAVNAKKPVVSAVSFPMSGQPLFGLEGFEREFCEFLRRWCVPGASIAVSKKGALVYARGFGWSDFETKEKVEPNSLFRIASISKSMTAVAALKLQEEGKLKLDEKVFQILNDFDALRSPGRDPRIDDITVRDLVYCTAGWNPKVSDDPLNLPYLKDVAAETGVSVPPPLHSLINFWLTKKLDFAPGSSWGYSNFAYEVLGAVIAKRAGEPYESFVKRKVLAPAGIVNTRVGRTVEQFPHEVRYYPYPGQPTVESIYPGVEGPVHYQYGGAFDLPTMAAAGGWISSSIDLVRFANSVRKCDNQRLPILSDSSFRQMMSRSPSPYWKGKKGYFAMGWEVYPVTSGSGYTFSRVGTVPGGMSFLVRRYDDTCWSVLFNSRPYDQDRFMNEAKEMIWKAVNRQKSWPSSDLFSKYK